MESSLDMIIKNGRLKSNNETYVIIYYKAHRDENDSQWSLISKYKILQYCNRKFNDTILYEKTCDTLSFHILQHCIK